MQYPHRPPRKGHACNMKRRPEKSSGAQRKGTEREDEEQKIEKLKNQKNQKIQKIQKSENSKFSHEGLDPTFWRPEKRKS